MFKKVIGLIAGFLALMFVVTLCQLKAETQTTAKELENKVIVYTTYDKEMTNIVKSEFEKSTSINVEIKKFANDTEMVNEIKDKKDTVPDVILGVSTNTCEELKKDNLLEANKPSWYSDVNDNQKDKEGYWYSLFASPIVMFYNTAVIKGEMVPQNLMALSDKKYANLVVMPKVESNDFKYFLNTVIAPYVKDNKVDDGFKALAALKFNIKEYKEPGNQVIDAVAKKEGAVGFADLVKVNEAIKKGSTLAVVYGTEKYPVITEGIAIMKNGSNSNAAKLFEEFAAGPKMQYKIANKFKFNPTNKKALELCGGEVSELKDRTYKIDMNEYNSNINSWIDKWNAIVKEEAPVDNKHNNANVAGTAVNNNAAVQTNGNNAAQNSEKKPAENAAPEQHNAPAANTTAAPKDDNQQKTVPAKSAGNNASKKNNGGAGALTPTPADHKNK